MTAERTEAGRVTVLLPVKNVAAILRPCLDSLRWADEILLIDGQSADGTLEVAAEYPNTRVVQHPSKDIRVIVQESQTLASHPWVFWFCADEVCSPELGTEIKQRVATAPPDVNHFMVPSRTRQFGVDCGEGETFPRVWRKGAAQFAFQRMHEMPDFAGKSEQLVHHYWHVNNPNIRTIIPKFLRYEYVDAQNATDAKCAQTNSSFWYQLARLNYYAVRVYWPQRKKGAAATLLAMTYGIGQSIRHLMLIDEIRIRRGETIRDTHGWT